MYYLLPYILLVIAISWTMTQEFVFADLRKYTERKGKQYRSLSSNGKISPSRRFVLHLYWRFYYLFSCEFCNSFWSTLLVVLLFYKNFDMNLILVHATIWMVSNLLMSIYMWIRLKIKYWRNYSILYPSPEPDDPSKSFDTLAR
jgi:hypothetical protein